MTDNPDAILTQLPARLKAARTAQGLSLDAVAKLSGVSRSMVSQIERGESSPTIATLWNLTRALQVDFAGLLDSAPTPAQIEVLRAAEVPTINNLGSGCRIHTSTIGFGRLFGFVHVFFFRKFCRQHTLKSGGECFF